MEQKLEKMDAFFDARVEGYEEHMLSDIDAAPDFYRETIHNLPKVPGMHVLDLGCGTGLELEGVFQAVPDAEVTGIDVSQKMLGKLHAHFANMGKRVTLVWGDYLEHDFGVERYDTVLSVESLHHFAPETKQQLYWKLHLCLKPGGVFLNTDYIAKDEAEQAAAFEAYARLSDGKPAGYFHFDTPLTVENECRLLRGAGFQNVRCVWQKDATAILLAQKEET